MLVLSRKPGQTVVIGEDVRITVVSVQGGRVTVGIEAPRDQRVLRGELSDKPDEPLIIDIPFASDIPTCSHPPVRTPL